MSTILFSVLPELTQVLPAHLPHENCFEFSKKVVDFVFSRVFRKWNIPINKFFPIFNTSEAALQVLNTKKAALR